jgi:hypothetical protein
MKGAARCARVVINHHRYGEQKRHGGDDHGTTRE